LDETDIEEALEGLEGLLQEEARLVVAELLDIVYGLIRNMRIVMDGERILLTSYPNDIFIRLGGQPSTESVRRSLGMVVMCVKIDTTDYRC
jgi:hypothetical protein